MELQVALHCEQIFNSLLQNPYKVQVCTHRTLCESVIVAACIFGRSAGQS